MYSPTRLLAVFLLLAGLFALPGAARPEPAQDDLKRLQQEVEKLQKLLKERDAQLAVQAAEVKQLNQRLKNTESALKDVLRQLETLTKALAKDVGDPAAKAKELFVVKGVIAKIDPKDPMTVQIKFDSDVPKGVASFGKGLSAFRLKSLEGMGLIVFKELADRNAIGTRISFGKAKGPAFHEGEELTFMGTIPNQPNPPPLPVHTKITKVGETLAEISVGSNVGLKVGHSLEVFRLKPQAAALGTLWIVDVQPSKSIGILRRAKGLLETPLQVGDDVADKSMVR
jgi:hypothetical protein